MCGLGAARTRLNSAPKRKKRLPMMRPKNVVNGRRRRWWMVGAGPAALRVLTRAGLHPPPRGTDREQGFILASTASGH
jgi:hypothetical protein